MPRLPTAYLMLLATVVLWAFNFTVTKYVLTHGFRPLAYSSIRYGAAAVLFAGFTYARERSFRVERRDLRLLVGCAALGIWANQIAYMYAVKFTTASTVALILGTTPIFAALLARAVGLERLALPFWLASVVSFSGVALVAIGSGGGVSADVAGDLLAVATAATWAGYSVAVAPLMRRYSPYRISAIVLLVGWIPLAATASRQLAAQDYGAVGWLSWLSMAYALMGPLVLTNVLWFTAIDNVGPSRATLFANLQRFIAVVFAVAILSERITPLQIAGGVAIGAGIAIARWRRRRRAPEPAAEEELEPVPAPEPAAR